jgi:hypothetical protein
VVFAIGCFGYDVIGWVWLPEMWVVLGFDLDYLVDVFTTVRGWVGFWAVIGFGKFYVRLYLHLSTLVCFIKKKRVH